MALKPTIEIIKAEHRIDFDADDVIIQSHIDAAADVILTQMHWVKKESIDLWINPSRFNGRVIIPMRVRGIVNGTLNYTDTDDTAVQVLSGDDTFEFADPYMNNRFINHIQPHDDWASILPNLILASDGFVTLSVVAGDAPAVIKTAISKLAVDFYRNNGVGSMPVKTAIDCMLEPFAFNL